MSMRKILLINGPNMDMLGVREPDVYGMGTLAGLENEMTRYAHQRGIELRCLQSNSEAHLIDTIHGCAGRFDGVVYNPGAHTHYSYALRDAVAAIDVPVVEVHISDVDAREPFRSVSVIAPVCVAQVKGLGFDSYRRAIDILCDRREFERLGEGYESRFPEGQHILVAGENVSGAAAASVAPVPEDFTEPFAIEIASQDIGALSAERLGQARDACMRLELGSLLVRDTSNIRWLTAFDGVFDEERAHALFVGRSGSVLHTDSRYSNALREAARRAGGIIIVNDERITHAQFAKAQMEACQEAAEEPSPRKLGFEDSASYAEFVKMAEAFGEENLSPTTDVVLGLRAVKTAPEITRMLAAQAVTDAAFAHIVGFMRPGMTEREVQLELEDFMLRHGAEALAFGSIVATGPNGADPHAVPGPARLEAGQCVVLDFGAKAHGYCSDMTRVVFLGRPEGEMADAWEVLRRANETVEAMLRPGVTGKEAHECAERVLAEGGFGGKMGHGLGHGVGMDVHELPLLNTRNDSPLVAGNVVTVEPGIYLPGEFGMRLEDCGVVTPDGYRVFSQLGHDMVVL